MGFLKGDAREKEEMEDLDRNRRKEGGPAPDVFFSLPLRDVEQCSQREKPEHAQTNNFPFKTVI